MRKQCLGQVQVVKALRTAATALASSIRELENLQKKEARRLEKAEEKQGLDRRKAGMTSGGSGLAKKNVAGPLPATIFDIPVDELCAVVPAIVADDGEADSTKPMLFDATDTLKQSKDDKDFWEYLMRFCDQASTKRLSES